MRVIYKFTCTITGKYYIGQHSDDADDFHIFNQYWGSGKIWRHVIRNLKKKYGRNYRVYIKREILFKSMHCSDEVLNKMERYWIYKLNSFYNLGRGNGYNLLDGASTDHPRHSEETKKKLRIKMKGRKRWDGFVEFIRSVNIGRIRSSETRKRMSMAQKKRFASGPAGFQGKKCSDEAKRKISEANRGKVRTPEMRKRLSEARLALHLHKTDEEKAEQSRKLKEYYKTHTAHMLGKVIPDETKKKISASLKGRMVGEKNPMHGKRFINNGIVNKIIKDGDKIPNGWKLGMVRKLK